MTFHVAATGRTKQDALNQLRRPELPGAVIALAELALATMPRLQGERSVEAGRLAAEHRVITHGTNDMKDPYPRSPVAVLIEASGHIGEAGEATEIHLAVRPLYG